MCKSTLDIVNDINRTYYDEDNENRLKEFQDSITKGTIKNKFEIINKNLEGKEWLTGFLSIADFQLFEVVDLIYEFDASKVEPYKNLLEYRKRFREMPQIKAHLKSKEFIGNHFIE